VGVKLNQDLIINVIVISVDMMDIKNLKDRNRVKPRR